MEEIKGKARGGAAKAAKMTPEQRKELAMKMVRAKKERASLPLLILKGSDLDIAGIKIPCAVIESPNGGEPMRVLTESGVTNAILGTRSGASRRLKKKAEEQGSHLPLFIAPGQLKSFINKDLIDGPLKAVEYLEGGRVVRAFDAQILPIVCEIWLKARDEGKLQEQQYNKAKQAEILMRGLARVGIIALVDEATGYQKFRAKDSLAKILESFVAKELQPWIRKFPPVFYEQMFRLRKLEFPKDSPRRPQYFGILTNNIIYRRLAPCVWKELKQRVAKDEQGRAKERLHQYLTPDIGDPRLRDLITSVTTIMRLSNDWHDFMAKLDILHPAFNETMHLPFDLESDSGVGF